MHIHSWAQLYSPYKHSAFFLIGYIYTYVWVIYLAYNRKAKMLVKLWFISQHCLLSVRRSCPKNTSISLTFMKNIVASSDSNFCSGVTFQGFWAWLSKNSYATTTNWIQFFRDFEWIHAIFSNRRTKEAKIECCSRQKSYRHHEWAQGSVTAIVTDF